MRGPAATIMLAMLASALAGCMEFGEDNNTTDTTEPTDDNGGFEINVTATATANATTNTTVPPNNTTNETGAPLEVVLRDAGSGGYAIDPSTLTAVSGQTVTLRIESHPNNIPGSIHRFTIEGHNVSTGDLSPGDVEWVNLTAAQPGTYAYWCPVGSHRELGMEGELTVQ